MHQPIPRLERSASLLLQLGALLVVVAALPFRTFELDRFFIPKELVLHLTATAVLMVLLDRPGRWRAGRTGVLLGAFLAVSVVSTLFATNPWLATRALAVSLSGIALYWAARAIAQAGHGRALLAGLAAAVVVGALTGLAQAYGLVGDVLSDFLSLARAPGGTFGNRNFLAHLCAIGIPAVVYLGLTARRGWSAAASGVALALLSAAVLLSRTRAAWLALIVAALVLGPAALWRWSVLRQSRAPKRAVMLATFAILGAAAGLLLPNRLSWTSDNPYLESAAGVVNYREGSGAGRLVQYRNSAEMAMRHPVLGVGPGNWAVAYPRYASRNDPSLGSNGMTSNPWPSSDWVAHLSERGPVATLLLLAAFVAMFFTGLRSLRRTMVPEDAAAALALCGTVVVTAVVGAFDAVLLLAAPALIAWSQLGALSVLGAPEAPVGDVGAEVPSVPPRRPHALVAAVGVLGAVMVLRSATMAAAIGTADGTRSTRALARAAAADPGSFRIRLAAAEAFARRGRCREATRHATAARNQFPDAPGPRQVLARCR